MAILLGLLIFSSQRSNFNTLVKRIGSGTCIHRDTDVTKVPSGGGTTPTTTTTTTTTE